MKSDDAVIEGVDTEFGGIAFARDQLSNDAYHANKTHYSRSPCHTIFRFGGGAQEFVKRGGRMFVGNAGTSLGTLFDTAWEGLHDKKSLTDLFTVPPPSVLSNGARRGKPYTDWLAEATSGNQTAISPDDMEKLTQMIRSCKKNRRAMQLLEETENLQASHFWTDAAGHRRKSRFDGHTEHLVYDVKSTSSTFDRLASSFVDYGYIWQAAWYSDSAYAFGWPEFNMPFICVQTVPFFGCEVFTVPKELVDVARIQIAETLDQIRLRELTEEYLPHDHGEEKELVFPHWAYGKREEV